MTDFDNGLPSEGIDISTSDINSVLIEKQEATEGGIFNVSSVVVEKQDVADSPLSQITGVLFEKEKTKQHNRCLFF